MKRTLTTQEYQQYLGTKAKAQRTYFSLKNMKKYRKNDELQEIVMQLWKEQDYVERENILKNSTMNEKIFLAGLDNKNKCPNIFKEAGK